jgi:hypothetical protein
MKVHPIAAMVPAANTVALHRILATVGQLEPIMTYEGAILDGRARFEIMGRLGKVARIAEYKGDDPVAYVLEANRNRLTTSQRAMLCNVLGAAYGRPAISLLQAADVSDTSVRRAMLLIKYGNESDVRRVVTGLRTLSNSLDKLQPRNLARRDRQNLSKLPELPKQLPPAPPLKERRTRIRSELWAHLREAFEHLNSLPRADEVAREVAKLASVSGIINQKLPIILRWFAEFEREWSRNQRTDSVAAFDPGAAGDRRGSDDDPGTGAQASKAQQD